LGRRDHTTWVNGTICPIHEKVDTMNGGNNRAVTLQGITQKIMANILYVKLVPHAEEITGEY